MVEGGDLDAGVYEVDGANVVEMQFGSKDSDERGPGHVVDDGDGHFAARARALDGGKDEAGGVLHGHHRRRKEEEGDVGAESENRWKIHIAHR